MIDMEKFPVLKSLNRLIITFFLALGVTFSMVAPFSVVYADSSPTYILLEAGNPITYNGVTLSLNTGEARIVYLSGGTKKYIYYVSNSNNTSQTLTFRDGNGNTDILYMSNTGVINNVTYNYESYLNKNRPMTWMNGAIADGYTPINVNWGLSNAVYYTYGAGAVDPVAPIDYGRIKDLSYSTSIVGSGTTTGDANIDTISWFPYWDTNSNISTTWNMEIQVVPGTWQGGTNSDIFSQTYQNFIINDSGAMSIYHGTYLNGSYSISWGEVKNKLSILSWADLFQYFDGTYWNKKGWVYRARFNDPDSGYWSDWQTVYTVTSSAGEGVENFIDPTDGTGLPDFYNNAVNSYNTTSVVNNNNNITYYYVNTPVETNPSDDDSTQYLKEIRDTIIQIRKMIAVDHNSDATPDSDNNPWIGDPAAELYDFEDSSINDFNDAVSNLPTSDLLQGNKFLNAAGWVRTQYEHLVLSTPFEGLIVFSLLLGFGLLLIGKLR